MTYFITSTSYLDKIALKRTIIPYFILYKDNENNKYDTHLAVYIRTIITIYNN